MVRRRVKGKLVNFSRQYGRFFLFATMAFCWGELSLAVVIEGVTHIPFTDDPTLLQASLNLPTREKTRKLTPSESVMTKRIVRSSEDDRVETVSIKVPADDEKLTDLAIHLAERKKSTELLDFFAKKIEAARAKNGDVEHVEVEFSQTELPLVRLDRLSEMLSKSHRDVQVDTRALAHQPELKQTLTTQLRRFLDKAELRRVTTRMQSQAPLSVDDYLLPEFARKMVEKFIIFRGPNCFHAALAFHGRSFPSSPSVNVKEEHGYHRSMINYDELWRAIDAEFYEVDPEKSQLKYGDMLVFFDVPEGESTPYFRWIRHTATYLFGPYTFSKGSKSADTPYSVKTLAEEWDTWRKYTKKLGVKIFRRSQKRVRKSVPVKLNDWIY